MATPTTVQVDSEQTRLQGKLSSSLGERVEVLLRDSRVTDLVINPDGRVWVERQGEGMSPTGEVFTWAQRMSLIKTVATMTGGRADAEHPTIDAKLPGSGARFCGMLPPAVSGPCVAIRCPAREVFPLESYVARACMSSSALHCLVDAVKNRLNVLVVGGTGSGKTTFVNALLREVALHCPAERVCLLEDTPELQCTAENVVQQQATHAAELPALLRATLRMRPDRIVVGEIRGAEALTLIKAWNTGHPGGFSTVHANSARAGLMRLEQMAAEGTGGFVPRGEVAEAVQMVVFVARGPQGRGVQQVLRVRGLDARGEYAFEEVA